MPEASSAELQAGTETGVRRFSPADIKSMAETFGGSGAWEYVSSHTLSTTEWPSANGANVSIDISSLAATDKIGFITEYAGTNNKF